MVFDLQSFYIPLMTCGMRIQIIATLFLASFVSVRARALDAAHAYEKISDRNVFNLKSAADLLPPKQPAAPSAKIFLTGITTLLGNKRALLTVQPPGKPPEFYILAEGQGSANVQVLTIDEVAGTVRVENSGVEQTLDFLKNGAAPGATAAATSMAHPIMPSAGGSPMVNSSVPIPIRTMRPSPEANTPTSQPATTENSSLASRVSVNPEAHTITIPQMTAEEQTILIELERERTKADVEKGITPPLPPTEITPEGSFGASALVPQ
jgi:hypothetical protein